MADKRISQLVDRGTVANNDVVPIVVSGATTTNKATISSIQTFMQGNLDLGVTSVGITLGSSGTDVSVSGSPITSSGNITINLPTASATNRGLLSAADWVTFNSKQDAGSFVTLDTAQTITAQKTFTTSGSSDTMIISHGSGSGFALDVLKAGNGEAIRVTKTSGSGNAMTISGGNFEAGTIVKTGGTSSQFLKADGSVDSSTYLTTGSAGSTYVPYSGAAASVNLGAYSITANAINSAGSGSGAGQINLRSDAFFSLVNGYGSIASGTTNQFNLYQTTGAGVFRGAILSLNSITASATRTFTFPDADGTLALSTDLGAYLPLTGGTLTGALGGTSATFTTTGNAVTITSSSSASNVQLKVNNGANGDIYAGVAASDGSSVFTGTTAYSGYIGTNVATSFHIATGGTARLTIASTGAATFSSSVTMRGNAIGDIPLVINHSWGGSSTALISASNSSAEVFKVDRNGAATFSSTVQATGLTAASAYSYLYGLRISGNDTGNTIYNPNANIGITSDSGYRIFIGQVSSSTIGINVLTTSGNVGIGTANPIIYSKLTVTGSISFNNNTDAALSSNEYGQAYSRKSTVVGGGSATSIKSGLGPEASIILVCGRGPTGSRFADLVLVIGQAGVTPLVIGSRAYATPASRTYTNGGENLLLQLTGDSDSYSVFITGIGGNELT